MIRREKRATKRLSDEATKGRKCATRSFPSVAPSLRRSVAFTLIEMMIALVVLGVLTAAAVLSFSAPVERARMVEAVEQVKYLDASSRDVSRRFGRNVQIGFDLSEGTMERREGRGREASFSTHVASPMRIEAVRTLGERKDYGETSIDVSSLGISQTYALK